ncbi:MAG: hypothetical protein JXB88_22025 [Spirochaetales bacterium]|nr:hypothetical protein [Spirochaetales bacterium]
MGENLGIIPGFSDPSAIAVTLALAGTFLSVMELQVIEYFLLFLFWVVGIANAVVPG